MFEFLKRKSDQRKKGPLIIMIHGFGKRRSDEYLKLRNALNDEYDMECPDLFDQNYEDDTVWHNWVSRAEEKIIAAKNDGRRIILIGFSMGGVIASYLAAKFKTEKLILLAPAFEYLTITTASNVVKSGLSKKETDTDYKELPSSFTSTFMDVVNNCKEGIEKVNCPTLFIASMKDELIPYTVTLKYYRKVKHDQKNCVVLPDGEHRLLDNEKSGPLVIALIKDYLKDEF